MLTLVLNPSNLSRIGVNCEALESNRRIRLHTLSRHVDNEHMIYISLKWHQMDKTTLRVYPSSCTLDLCEFMHTSMQFHCWTNKAKTHILLEEFQAFVKTPNDEVMGLWYGVLNIYCWVNMKVALFLSNGTEGNVYRGPHTVLCEVCEQTTIKFI